MANDLTDAAISLSETDATDYFGAGEISFNSTERHAIIQALEILPNEKFYRIDASCLGRGYSEKVCIDEIPPDDNGYPFILYRLTFEGLVASIYKRGNEHFFNVIVYRADRQTWIVVMIVNDKQGLEILGKGLLPLFIG